MPFNDFLTLYWCKSNLPSVEPYFKLWSLIFSQPGDKRYNPLRWCWVSTAPSQPCDRMGEQPIHWRLSCTQTTVLFSTFSAAAAAKSLQSCPTLCYGPIDGSPPGSLVPGILQARTVEWVAISFSIAWKWKVKVKSLSRVRLCATQWTAAYQAPPSMGFSRQECLSGLPLPSPCVILSDGKTAIK